MSKKREFKNPIAAHLFKALSNGDGYKVNLRKLEAAGIVRQVVHSWLNGRRNPDMTSLKKVADILNFNLNSWFKDCKLPQGNNNQSLLYARGKKAVNSPLGLKDN